MFFRRKKRNETGENPPVLQDKAAKKIANGITKVQNSFAQFFGRKTKRLSREGKIFLLGFILMIFGGLSLYNLITVFITRTDNISSLKQKRIALPKYFDRSSDVDASNQILVSEKLFRDLQLFKHYMDSLQHSKYGKPKRDSILQSRPGLLDSVEMLEKLYYEQQKLSK